MSEMMALVHFHFKVDPDTMDLDTLAKYFNRLQFALNFENKRKTF